MKRSHLTGAMLFVMSIVMYGCADRSSHILHTEVFDSLRLWIGAGIILLLIFNLFFKFGQAKVKGEKTPIYQFGVELIVVSIFSLVAFSFIGEWWYVGSNWLLGWMGETVLTILFALSGLSGAANIVTFILFGFAFKDETFLKMVAWQTGVSLALFAFLFVVWIINLAKIKLTKKVKDSFVEGSTDKVKLQNDAMFNVLVQIAYADSVLKKEEKEFLAHILKGFEFKDYTINVDEAIQLAKEKALNLKELEAVFSDQNDRFALMKFCLIVASIDSEFAPAEVELVKLIQSSLKITDEKMQILIKELSESK